MTPTPLPGNDAPAMLSDGQWYRDPHYPMETWRAEVCNGDTRSNYMDWVLSMYELDDRPPPADFLAEWEALHDDALPQVPSHYLDKYPEEDWMAEVEEIDTRLGYQSWVVSQLQFDDDWLDYQDRLDRAQSQGDALDSDTIQPSSVHPRPRI